MNSEEKKDSKATQRSQTGEPASPDSAKLSRRKFLRFVAGTSIMAAGALGLPGCGSKEGDTFITNMMAANGTSIPIPEDNATGKIVKSASQAYNVFDLRAVAEVNIPPAHWGYLESGVNGDVTLRANESGFQNFYIRPKRMVDVSKIDTQVTLFGRTWPTPIILCPSGSHKSFHAEGELAVARAAQTLDHLQCLSSVASTSITDVNAARGEPVWFQLYPSRDWEITKFVVAKAEAAGCSVMILTVDNLTRRSDTYQFFRAKDTRDCATCHAGKKQSDKPLYADYPGDKSNFGGISPNDWDWSYVAKLRGITNMKIIMKGIVTAEDATECLKAGVDGVFVSNHGGRGEESGRATILSLPEVASVLKGKIPIILDSGIRRGTSIFKALALGADAIGIGRPYLWGLGAFGQDGVEACLKILTADLRVIMASAGTPNISSIDSSFVPRA